MPNQCSVAEAVPLSHLVTLTSGSFPSVSALFPKGRCAGDCRSLEQWVHTDMALISPYHIICMPLGIIGISASSAKPCRARNVLPGPQEGDGVGKLYSAHSAGVVEDLPVSEVSGAGKKGMSLGPSIVETVAFGSKLLVARAQPKGSRQPLAVQESWRSGLFQY